MLHWSIGWAPVPKTELKRVRFLHGAQIYNSKSPDNTTKWSMLKSQLTPGAQQTIILDSVCRYSLQFIGMQGTVRVGREPGQRQHKTWSNCIFTNGEIAQLVKAWDS